MITKLVVLSSDAVNRYGFRMHIKALEGGILQKFDSGLPYLINHDFHRPLGWGVPFALFIEPHLTRMLSANIIPETDEEFQVIHKLHQQAMHTKYNDESKPFKKEFQEILSLLDIKDYNFIATNCLTNYSTGIAVKIFPDLFSSIDKEGLISLETMLKDFTYLGQGVFKNKSSEVCVLAHRYFRRSQSVHNLTNGQFVDEFVSLHSNKELNLYLCLDDDQVGYAPSFGSYEELEFIYGPQYNDNIASIKPGLVQHQNTDADRRLSVITSTEILWEWDKNFYTFQLEEVSDIEAPMEIDSVYHCRYIHSLYDESIRDFCHFDGAIRIYPFEDMVDRASKNFKEYGKNSGYKKLFKVNGKLPIHKWKSLVTFYLRGNQLVYEYFGKKAEIELFKTQPSIPVRLVDKLTPFRITENEGMKLLVSYFPIKEMQDGRYIDSFDIMSDDTKQFRCVDFPILELKKALQRLDDDLLIPSDVEYIKCDDRYWNIPSIMHAGPDCRQLMKNTISALKTLFAKMLTKGLTLDISITLGAIVDSKIIKVSAFGNVKILNRWLEESMPFPANQIEFTEWLSQQNTFLNKYENTRKDTFIDSLVQMDGVLYAKRMPITYPYELDIDDRGLTCRIELPTEDEYLIKSGQIKMVATLIVEKCVCSDTGEDYFVSKRSKWLDDDLPSVDIVSASPLAIYWSNP